ncbi:MAG TPA: hypothetical protein VGQ10_00665 [Vicinamibacterales bacterium]|jgi:hypothetical protein|nr:hypothetical protein [Vicinamibacterales bacterium]
MAFEQNPFIRRCYSKELADLWPDLFGGRTMIYLVLALAMSVAVPQEKPAGPTAEALHDFAQRLNGYLGLRDDLGRKLGPLAPTDAGQLRARQQALAAALRNARKNAKPGDLIPSPVQQLIRQAIRADFTRRNPADKRAALEEVPEGPLPRINATYPEQAAQATVPPLLLATLPSLPDNLQYRFFSRHVVILDGDVEIVIDYVRNTLPPY